MKYVQIAVAVLEMQTQSDENQLRKNDDGEVPKLGAVRDRRLYVDKSPIEIVNKCK